MKKVIITSWQNSLSVRIYKDEGERKNIAKIEWQDLLDFLAKKANEKGAVFERVGSDKLLTLKLN